MGAPPDPQAANLLAPPGPDPQAQHPGRNPPASAAAGRAAQPTTATGGPVGGGGTALPWRGPPPPPPTRDGPSGFSHRPCGYHAEDRPAVRRLRQAVGKMGGGKLK